MIAFLIKEEMFFLGKNGLLLYVLPVIFVHSPILSDNVCFFPYHEY